MKKSTEQETTGYARKVDKEGEKRNYAKERLKIRLKTLRRKIFHLEKKAQRNKKLRMAPVERLIQEYNQTLELIYGKGAAVLPNLRLRARTVEVYVPSIEAGTNNPTRTRTGLKKSSSVDEMPTPQVIYADDSILEQAVGFDSFRTIDQLTEDIELLEAIQDRMEHPQDYLVYVVQPDQNVKPGEMLFVVQDMYGTVEFAVTIGLIDTLDGRKKSYAPFIKELAVDLFERGYECTFFVNQSDIDNGLVTPKHFDDDADPYYPGGADYDDEPPTFSFS